MLADKTALHFQTGAHHKALLSQAYALHENKLIDSDDLSDPFELVDGALVFAVESMLWIDNEGYIGTRSWQCQQQVVHGVKTTNRQSGPQPGERCMPFAG